MEFTVKKVAVCRVAIFLNKALHQISQQFTKYSTQLKVPIWTAKCDLNKEL